MSDALRPAGAMATGTVLSRLSGMVRNSALIAAIGTGVFADTYTVANTLPNILYILTAGGALNAVLIPQLVRHMNTDPDGGQGYTDRLLTAVLGVLVGITALALLLAPLLVRLYASRSWTPEDLHVSTLFAWFCLPQILFYGLYTVLAQVLNVRGRFGAPMFAPIVNNLVVIVACVLFAVTVAGTPTTGGVTTGQIALLGIGTTLGVIAQALVLLPVLARSDFHWRLRTDLRGSGIGKAAWLAGWTLALVAINQLAYIAITRLATTANAEAVAAGSTRVGGITTYSMAYLIFILPQSVVTVSIVTALFPRMSRNASRGDLPGLRSDVGRALISSGLLIVPAAVALIAFGVDVGTLLFNYGATDAASAAYIGHVLQAFAVGLIPFSAYYILMRGFYAMEDTRTPALMAIPLGLINVGLGWLLFQALPAGDGVFGLALGYSVAYLVMVFPLYRMLRRRYGGMPIRAATQMHVKVGLAAAAGAGLALAVTGVVGSLVALPAGPLGALLRLAISGAVMLPVFVTLSRALGVTEMDEALRQVAGRLRR